MRNLVKQLVLVLLISIASGCSDAVKKKDIKVSEEKSVIANSQLDKKNTVSVQVSTSGSNTSKPLSELSGNAKNQKNDELYIVPNHEFPVADKQKKKPIKDKKTPKKG